MASSFEKSRCFILPRVSFCPSLPYTMMTFHLLNLNQQLTTLLIASIIFKQIIVNSFKNIYQIYAYIYKSLEHLQNIQISTRSFKKRPLSLRSVRLRICRGLRIEHSLQSIFVRIPICILKLGPHCTRAFSPILRSF